MKYITTKVVAVAVIVLGFSSLAAGQGPPPPRNGACFYENANFDGRYFCARVGDDAPRVPDGADDQVSSIRVFGNAQVTVYQNSNFSGQSRNYDRNIRNLADESFNDRITSYRVSPGGYSSGDWNGGGFGGGWDSGWGRPQVPRSGVCFYQNPNFRGDYFCSKVGLSASQVPPGTNDRIASVRVFGNASVRVYRDFNYRGPSQTIDVDEANLRRSGWGNAISSYQVVASRYGNNNWGGAFGGGSHNNGSWEDRNNVRMSYTQAQAVVQRAYRRVLGRDPDPAAAGWVREVMNGNLDERGLQVELRKSPEYLSKQR